MANVSSSNGIEKRPKLQFSKSSHWQNTYLDCICNISMGQSPDSLSYNSDGVGLPLVQGNADITDRITTPTRFTSQPTKIASAEDIIMSVRAPVGTVSIANQKVCCGRGVCSIRAKNNCLQEFLYQLLLLHEEDWRNVEQGGTFKAISGDDIRNFSVNIPSLSEQEKISSFLEKIDERIRIQKRIIEYLKKYKRGLLQAIFSREVQLENSTCWERRLFSEIASLSKGKYSPKQDEVLPCIELEHLEQQTGQIIGYANSNEQNSVKSVFHKGDVLFGKLRPYLRKFALPEYDGVCSSEIWVFHPEHDINSTFLFYLIQSESFIAAANISSGTKMPRAEWSKVSNESFFIPELSEQKRIADLFSSIDKRIVNASRSANEMQSLKQGLLQQLFI